MSDEVKSDEVKKSLAFTNSKGEYFPWLEELWAWAEDQKAKGAYKTEWRGDEIPKLKLSQYVEFLQAVRTEPDLMARIADWTRRHPVPPPSEFDVDVDEYEIDDNDIDHYELVHVVGMFVRWYAIKNHGIAHSIRGRTSIYNTLYQQARGVLPLNDVTDAEALRLDLFPAEYIDDLK